VIDIDSLSSKQLGAISQGFDELADREFLPFARMRSDPARARLDEIWQKAHKLQDISKIRELLGREPVVGHQRL